MMPPARAAMFATLLAMMLALFAGAAATAQANRQLNRPPVGNAAIAADEPAEDEEPAIDENDPAADEEEPAADEEEPADESVVVPPPQAARPPMRAPQRVQQRTPPRPAGLPASPAQAMRPQPSRPAAKPQTAPVQSAAGLPDLEDLTATRERPLFSSTRRPPEPVEEPDNAPIAEGASMPFELVGIVIGADVSAAIFRNTASKEETRVAKGEKIGRWSLDEIADGAVVLGGSGRRVRMRLFDPASAPGVRVTHVGGEAIDEGESAAHENEEQVDEDIAPSSSPQVKPATAHPKPPPALRREEQMRRRLNRLPHRANQRPPNNGRQ
jgi:general secretion pathway protein N